MKRTLTIILGATCALSFACGERATEQPQDSGAQIATSAPTQSSGPDPESAAPMPIDDLQRAQGIFDSTCARCHTRSGVGEAHHAKDGIPNFTDLQWQARTPDLEIATTIRDGKGKHMPSFKARLDDNQIAMLLKYIRGFPERASATDAVRSPPTELPRVFEGRGIVEEIDASGKYITISHDAIEGFMGAMTMEFPLDSPGLAKHVTPGDRVAFKIAHTPTGDTVTALSKL